MIICQELYNHVCNANIKNSIFEATKIILKDPDKNFEILLFTMISLCSYIGSFISIYEIRLWLNVISDIFDFVESENINIKDVYIIITKLCILCDIYIKHPVTKIGTTNIKLLRQQIINIFQTDFKLTDVGISRFEGVLPPYDSHSYSLARQLITGFVFLTKSVEKLQIEHGDKVSDIANQLRKSFDYVIRKKYTFETKFFESDNDAIWFLWGVISILYNDPDIDKIYHLFSLSYNKKLKQQRIGLLWGTTLAVIYITKRDIARNWNQKELLVIKKIDEVHMDLYKDIKRELIKLNEINLEITKPKTLDGLDYIYHVRHMINEQNEQIKIPVEETVKLIKYKH